ncbi:hypothetical protein R1sor_021629 [Riccia sorocarpa]|uniref:START domain-containing protein n=1 Tax=Riccia sorocarpa TaxID=122646 RepID=A0ABD3GHL5_9MARC
MEIMHKQTFSIFNKPAVVQTCADLLTMFPFWVAIAIGLVLGWSWKPRWVSLLVLGLRTRPRLVWSTPPGFGARRVWLAVTAYTAYPVLKEIWLKFRSWMWPRGQSSSEQQFETSVSLGNGGDISNDWALTTEDLVEFCNKVECQDRGVKWNELLERSADGMFYQAWRRDPVDNVGPTEYKTRLVMDNATPEEIRDFFWDDEYRKEWDDMCAYAKTWEECPRTGSMVVQWVRKFPFFCKDREYIISRRIWDAGNAYYCVSKAYSNSKIPRRTAPRRVDVYYSSWRIRAVESLKGDGQMTACEVLLFHHEDMGIQRDLAKLGIRQGMWGCVKKMQPGLRKYQTLRGQGKPPSNCARMARINTKVPTTYVRNLSLLDPSILETDDNGVEKEKSKGGHLRWFILGGALALACGVDRGAVGKVLVFGLARRLGRLGRKAELVTY